MESFMRTDGRARGTQSNLVNPNYIMSLFVSLLESANFNIPLEIALVLDEECKSFPSS
jgi:hypothetical protein